jgi:hypothetical protein
MQENKFENQVRDLLYDHQVTAPDVISKVFEKRTPLHIFRNRLLLNKYKLLAAGLMISVLAFLFTLQFDKTKSEPPVLVENQTGNSQTIIHDETLITDSKNDQQIVVELPNDYAEAVEINKTPILSGTQISNDDSNQDNFGPLVSQHTQQNKVLQTLNDVNNSRQTTQSRSDVPNQIQISEASVDISQVDKLGSEPIREAIISSIQEVDDEIVVEIPAHVEVENTNDPSNLKQVFDKATESSSTDNAITTGEDEDFGLTKTKMSRFSITIGAGPGIGSRKVASGGDHETVVARDNTETQRLSFSTDLLLNYKASSNVEFFSGASLFNRREKMSYEHAVQVTETNITSKKVIEYHPVFGTREITVFDTAYNTKDVNVSGSHNNSYKHVTIPLGIRYTLYRSKTLGVYGSAHFGFEIMTQTEGYILDGQYNEVNLSDGFSRTSLGSSAGISGGVAILLNERLNLLIEPRTTWYLKPTNSPNYPINQLDRGSSLLIGLKYSL